MGKKPCDRRRVAVFTPVRPIGSGISDYCEELLPRLAEEYSITVFTDGYDPENPDRLRGIAARRALQFRELHAREPFDLAVYHLGNAPCHNYIYPTLYHVPGLVVLHDLHLHQTRLHEALRTWRGEEYRAEAVAALGERGGAVAELALAGMHGQLLLRHFPLFELPVKAGLMTAVHDEWAAEHIRRAVPGARVRTIPHPPLEAVVAAGAAARVRERYGIPVHAFVLGCFGNQTPEKRVPQLLRALAWLRCRRPEARCILAGSVGGNLQLDELLGELDLGGAVIATGALPLRDFLEHMSACDVVANLRWPTVRESSGVAVRAMSLGLPVLVTDLAHWRDLPDCAVVRIPLIGEEHALRRALWELAENRPLRQHMGENARNFVRDRHSWVAVLRRWEEVMDECVGLAAVAAKDLGFLPAHLH